MKFELFIIFNGNAREAVEFYAEVFRSEIKNLMTFEQAPTDPNYPLNPDEKDKIMYAEVKIGDKNIMFMDNSVDFPLTMGDNIQPTLNLTDRDEIDRIFNELKEGGEVFMAPQKTFFSEYYAMTKDKFGVVWQILYNTGEEG